MAEVEQKAERQEYTIMIVPHQGALVRRFNIQVKVVRYVVAAVCAAVLFFAGTYINSSYKLHSARLNQAELEQYRQSSTMQQVKLDQLAQETATLQGELERLAKLETDVRSMLKNEPAAPVSRSGIVRTAPVLQGQGGPKVKPTVDDLMQLVTQLKQDAQDRQVAMQELQNQLIEINEKQAVTPSIWPIDGEVTSRYGWRDAPIGQGDDWHPGMDIAAPTGTPIRATADGVVVISGWNGGYGNMVQLDHGNGVITLYGHNSRNVAEVGARVKKGQVIAYVGSTGYSTGPHVHYEVKINGNTVNPANFL